MLSLHTKIHLKYFDVRVLFLISELQEMIQVVYNRVSLFLKIIWIRIGKFSNYLPLVFAFAFVFFFSPVFLDALITMFLSLIEKYKNQSIIWFSDWRMTIGKNSCLSKSWIKFASQKNRGKKIPSLSFKVGN